jgi:hypothetical protein
MATEQATRTYRADFTASGYVEFEAASYAEAVATASALVRYGVPEPVSIAWYSGTEVADVYEAGDGDGLAHERAADNPTTGGVDNG